MLTARNGEDLKDAVTHLGKIKGGKLLSYQGDMLMPQVVKSLQEFLKKKFGSLDHLVCNIGSGRSVSPGEEDRTEAQRMMEINFLHVVQAIQSFRPLLRRDDPKSKDLSTITLIGSICGRRVLGCPSSYAAAKAALLHYSRNLVKPLAREGIRINVVSPGNIIFPGSIWEQKLKTSKTKVMAMLEKDVPLRKFGTPEDIGSAVVYLASRSAGFITGIELVVDGGQSN
jgi:3-oxoacyl-[acyl-carrier protein] reductase